MQLLVAFMVAAMGPAPITAAEADVESDAGSHLARQFLLGPPEEDDPVRVQATFLLEDVTEINDEDETFQFTGVLTLKWRDRRRAFDAAALGVSEKVDQGAYQFNEVFAGWFPQVVLVNESGMYDKHGLAVSMSDRNGKHDVGDRTDRRCRWIFPLT